MVGSEKIIPFTLTIHFTSATSRLSSMAGTPRTDLRQYEELRPMAVEFNIAPEATASVILLQGKTKVSVSVCGPSQPRYLRHEVYDQCTLDVEYRANYYSSVSNRNVIENEGVSMVKKTFEPALLLEQYPRMMILIKINVLQDGGSLNAVVSNACTLALCQSGIPMSYIPVIFVSLDLRYYNVVT